MDTRYIEYDPDEIWLEMQLAYIDAGGELLVPGDEKEMLLRGVQQIIIQLFGKVDGALRMATLSGAEGEYLDLYGEKRGCTRLEAQAATADIQITFASSGQQLVIPAGTALTSDGKVIYLLSESITQSGLAQTINTHVRASVTGVSGNALVAGSELYFLTPYSAVSNVVCTASATGGMEREDDDTYRERIRSYGLVNITTGPRVQYEAAAKKVSSVIVDAAAENLGAGAVGIYLLLSDTTGAQAIIEDVEKALSADTVRPLTDTVTVMLATAKSYTLNVDYYPPEEGDISAEIAAAVNEYKSWQDTQIGLAFNPDKLKALLFQAGALRVEWGAGSAFDGGDVEYTEIDPDEYCTGTITLNEVQS